ncbi:MAG: phosphoribosylanthranilate isomerase [Candidatus Hadarchaeales archaeon]
MIVKICGLMRVEDAVKASRLGADMIGTVLIEGSRRKISTEKASEIFSAVREIGKTKCVVLCRPFSLREVLELDEKLKPDCLQLHPATPISLIEEIKKEISSDLILIVPIPSEGANFESVLSRMLEIQDFADFLLLDTFGPQGGGTGKPHDWEVSRRLVERSKKPVLLAGGLSPENVLEAIKVVRPAGVDVASGVEEEVGVKDEKLMKEFIRKAKGGFL